VTDTLMIFDFVKKLYAYINQKKNRWSKLFVAYFMRQKAGLRSRRKIFGSNSDFSKISDSDYDRLLLSTIL